MIAKIKIKNAERADNPLCGYEQVGISNGSQGSRKEGSLLIAADQSPG